MRYTNRRSRSLDYGMRERERECVSESKVQDVGVSTSKVVEASFLVDC